MTKSQMLPIKVDKGTGQPVVLLHGLGNNHRSWSYVVDELDTIKNRVLVPDLLGFGDAPKPKPAKVDYSADDHADAVIALLDKLKVEQAIMAGHSMGAIVAVTVALKRPDLVKRLVLLGPPLYRRMPRGGFWDRIRHADGAYFTIFSLLAKNPDMTITAAKAADKLSPLLKGMEVTEETWPAFVASLRQTIMQVRPYRDITGLTVPTLLVHGKLDVFVVKRNLRRAARSNRRSVRFESVLGPHEITPLQGKMVAGMLQDPQQRSQPLRLKLLKKVIGA